MVSATPAPSAELTLLNHPTEAAVMQVLKGRLMADLIYTSVNTMLLAINPCQILAKLYSTATLERYLGSEPDLPPHIFLTAARMYRGVLQGRCQSVVISGESGAGKTQSFKRVIQFVSAATGGAHRTPVALDGHRSVEQQLVSTVQALESLGNASTMHNPDSSRFGKFVMIHFSDLGALHGVAVKTYLLETTRVVNVGPGERSFHIFYELMRGAQSRFALQHPPAHMPPLPRARACCNTHLRARL